MTAYTADAGEIAVHARTLAAGVEDPIYLRFNSGGAAAALPAGDGGSACQVLLPGQAVKADTSGGDASRVRLICAGAATYSVSEA